jgi:hypothetical protein
MKKEDMIDRHWRLWEEQNKQIRRTVATSLVFAIVALFNIIIPYKSLYVEKAEIARQIDEVQTKLTESEAAFEQLKTLDDVMANVSVTLENRPWDAQRLRLIGDYSRLRRRDSGTPQQYQSMADSTVRSISAEVKEGVYEPLAPFLNQQSGIGKSAPETMQQATTLIETLEAWEAENIGKTWYRTLSTKEATINELSNSLDHSLMLLARTLDDERNTLRTNQQQLEQQIKALQDVNLEGQEKELEELENRMTQALPSWIRGLISIEQLALYFPHLIAGTLIFILWLGHTLSLHYAAATTSVSKQELIVDPALSSNWTLTRRGIFGALQSLGTYLLYTAAMFFAFEKGLAVLQESNIAEPLREATFVFSPQFFWILRIAMIATAVYVLGRPFINRHKA